MMIPRRLLVVAGPFGERLGAERVGALIARGLAAGGWGSEPFPLAFAADGRADVRALLDRLGFDPRMRASRAIVLAHSSLREETLAGSAAFEIATRARQAGVPAFAVTAENRLDSFDARILDLQAILQARSARTLQAAGLELARLI